MDLYGFYRGESFDAFEWMGAHVGPGGVTFRVYAPNAQWVNLLYKDREIVMQKCMDGKFYEITLPEAGEGDTYEYRVYNKAGGYVDHCDPYGFGMELRPNHKSIVRNRFSYQFHDEAWIKNRSDEVNGPLNIYEMHLGSWKKPAQEKKEEEAKESLVDEANSEDVWYTYEEIAEPLSAYLVENGYNYVEFMPLSEHPCDNSWGYQNTGFFAATSRYGTMDQLKYLVDHLHQKGIGVILDYVPVHFAVDSYGLGTFDGTPTYEYPHPDVAVSEWGSFNFQHAKGEVRSFLQSSAEFWIREMHFDGLRMDAISRIIYWMGDQNRGENKEAIEFVKFMNKGLKWNHPGIMLIAEDSTDFPNVTKPVDQGGLGYDYKWDMGWMHDTLEFFQMPAYARKPNYHKLTFSMMYFWNEHYLLPLSHDEVVHGKATILQKMNGSYEDKFPQARAMYLYMMMHPGKTLNFMGNEFGQLREWDEKKDQDWFMLKYPLHDSFHHYMMELNHIYLEHDAFYAQDYEYAGFDYLDCHQEDRLIYAIQRNSKDEELIAVFNFDSVDQNGYVLELTHNASIEILLNTEWFRFNGSLYNDDSTHVRTIGNKLICDLPRYSGVLMKVTRYEKVKFTPEEIAAQKAAAKAAKAAKDAELRKKYKGRRPGIREKKPAGSANPQKTSSKKETSKKASDEKA